MFQQTRRGSGASRTRRRWRMSWFSRGTPAVLAGENIRDRRSFCYPIVPPPPTNVDAVPTSSAAWGPLDHRFHSPREATRPNRRKARYLPRRIVGATKIRWKYAQAGADDEDRWQATTVALFERRSGREIGRHWLNWRGWALRIRSRRGPIRILHDHGGRSLLLLRRCRLKQRRQRLFQRDASRCGRRRAMSCEISRCAQGAEA